MISYLYFDRFSEFSLMCLVFHLKRHDQIIVLQSIVTGAITWIKAGLPLKKLKIVLYRDDDKELNHKFAKLKKTHRKFQIKVSLFFFTSRKYLHGNYEVKNWNLLHP